MQYNKEMIIIIINSYWILLCCLGENQDDSNAMLVHSNVFCFIELPLHSSSAAHLQRLKNNNSDSSVYNNMMNICIELHKKYR